ncbi:hypothetical protein [Dichotomicrobium thermohalophilum]|uniref:hypothetical protein n=1 Tax=Dichotomicrobium thermohalophilum TaxID=933063 RepID=UPI0011C21B89|nr:hypothetical protein [Dichotomicrobium thermohalophilum]
MAVLLILVALPFPALANGSPCGSPPKLDNTEAARAVSAAFQADLGSKPVDPPFLASARESVDAIANRYGLSRGDVVARYVFHICEALYSRGTEGEQLSQVLSRAQEALDAPGPTKKAAANKTNEPVVRGGGARVSDEPETAASAQTEAPAAAETDGAPAVTKSLESLAKEQQAAPQRTVRRFQYRAAPKRLQNNLGINQLGIAQNQPPTIKRNAPAAGRTTTPRSVTQPRAAPQAETASPDVPTTTEEAPRAAAELALDAPKAMEVPATQPEAAEEPESADNLGEAAERPATPEQPRVAATEAAQPTEEPAAPAASRAPAAAVESEADVPGQERAPASTTAPATAATEPETAHATREEGACPERGVLGADCFDVDAALERLRDRPVEYNHPQEMIKGQATEITLVLRTDFTEEGLPEETSEAFERLQGEVKQQRAKISNIMSARLRGRDFEVDPKGMQERTITWRRPVEWSWYVTPKAGGENKRLELELYAHIVNPQGETQPPVLIKTLDATIDVDVRTLDWLIEQARTFEPIYAIAAAIIGFFTALITLWLRRRPAHPGDGPPSGITASPTPPQRRVTDMGAGEAAAEAARKGQDAEDNGKGRG